MQPNTRRSIYKVVVVSGLVFSIIPLILAKQYIYYPLIKDPLFPFGNLLAALVILCFVSLGHVFINPLFCPASGRQRILRRISIGLITMAVLWLPVGYVLAGDFAANFAPSDSFQGSNDAGVIYRNYTIGLLVVTPVFWIISVLFKRYELREETLDSTKY